MFDVWLQRVSEALGSMWTDEQMRVKLRKMNPSDRLGGEHGELGVIYRAENYMVNFWNILPIEER